MFEETNTGAEIMPDFEFEIDVPEDFTEKPPVKEETPEVVAKEETTEEVTEEVKEEETPEVITETKEEEVTEEESDLPEGADPAAYAIYSVMVEKGYLNETDEFKGTYAELDEMFETLPEQVFNAAIEPLNPKAKALLEYAYSKENVSDEDMAEFYNKYLNNAPADVTTEDGQIAFLSDVLQKEGHSEDDATDLIALWQDKGKLENKAKFYQTKHEDLSDAKSAIEKENEKKDQRKENTRKLKAEIQEELNKTSWSAKRKDMVMREIFSGEIRKKTSNIIQHPKAFYQLADFMTYLNPKTGEFDLEAYKKQGLTPEIKTIKNTIEKRIGKSDFVKGFQGKKEGKSKGAQEFEFITD